MSRVSVANGSAISAALLSLFGSACCAGPLMVIFTGVGLSGGFLLSVENLLGPFRPLLFAVTAAAIGLGFWSSRRSPYRQGVVCPPSRFTASRLVLWASALLYGGLLYFTYVHPNLDLWFGIY